MKWRRIAGYAIIGAFFMGLPSMMFVTSSVAALLFFVVLGVSGIVLGIIAAFTGARVRVLVLAGVLAGGSVPLLFPFWILVLGLADSGTVSEHQGLLLLLCLDVTAMGIGLIPVAVEDRLLWIMRRQLNTPGNSVKD